MSGDLSGLLELMGRALRALEGRGGPVVLVYHDDADGVTSAAIAAALLERLGLEGGRVCLEKAYPQALEMVHERAEGGSVVYVDIGSPHAKLIHELSERHDTLAVILDHHDAPNYQAEGLFNINPEFFGFDGERDASGSTVAYLFAKVAWEGAAEHSGLALVGSYEIPGPVRGLNELVLSDALEAGMAKVVGEDILVRAASGYVSRRKLSKALTILGSVGYYKGGPELGVRACLEGFPEGAMEEARRYEEMRRAANRRLLSKLARTGLRAGEYVQWFKDSGVFSGMGGKVIGTFCSYLAYRGRLVDRSKYLVGFMEVSPEIPGLGRLPSRLSKFSVRTPDKLREMVRGGKRPPASQVSVRAAQELGGFADGHAFAASGVVPLGREDELAERIDAAVSEAVGRGRKSSITDFL